MINVFNRNGVFVLVIGLLVVLAFLVGQTSATIAVNKYTDHLINGVYFPGETVCIHLAGRTPNEINKTTYHEVCHNLVDTDYDHFCVEPFDGIP